MSRDIPFQARSQPPTELALPEQITRSITVDDNGCWIWKGSKNQYGYGLTRLDGTTRLAHRVTYSLVNGDIPAGVHLDHLCRIRCCVNPFHLDPVTQAENTARSPLTPAGQTCCRKCGGDFGITGGKRPQRRCLRCAGEYQRGYRTQYMREYRRGLRRRSVVETTDKERKAS